MGALGLALGDLTISGRNFDAQTVRVGNFKSTLTGNQVFSSHTLNAGGSVDASVGGDASGPINASQSVAFNVLGALSGAIAAGTDASVFAATLNQLTLNASGNAQVSADTVTGSNFNAGQNLAMTATTVAQTTASASQSADLNVGTGTGLSVQAGQDLNVKASGKIDNTTIVGKQVTIAAPTINANVKATDSATVTGGNVSGTFTAGSVKLAGTGSVSGTVNATTVSVSAPQGSVAGNWQSLDAGSGGGVLVNSQPVTLAASSVNPSQIVVENFTLPAGTIVAPKGQLVLPQGVVVGLLSPAGASGAPKLVQVQSVQDLGSLLSQGYTGIVIDLSSRGGAVAAPEKPQQLSQN
jgi:hypothetical protein